MSLTSEDSAAAHEQHYFSMGKRSRKARKREQQNLAGRGFPHQVEDAAHDTVALAVALTGRALAVSIGTHLTVFDQRCV